MFVPGDGSGCVVLRDEDVPPQWRERAVRVALVVLLPEETSQLLGGTPVAPQLDADELRLARLVRDGHSATAIARALGVTTRTAYRRLQTLRERFGASTTADLRMRLARHPV